MKQCKVLEFMKFLLKLIIFMYFPFVMMAQVANDDNKMILDIYEAYNKESYLFTTRSTTDFKKRTEQNWLKLLRLSNGLWVSENYKVDGFKVIITDRTITLFCEKKWVEYNKTKILLGPTFDFYLGESLCRFEPRRDKNELTFFFVKSDNQDAEGKEETLDGCTLRKSKAH
jgi:hypothetical protein